MKCPVCDEPVSRWGKRTGFPCAHCGWTLRGNVMTVAVCFSVACLGNFPIAIHFGLPMVATFALVVLLDAVLFLLLDKLLYRYRAIAEQVPDRDSIHS